MKKFLIILVALLLILAGYRIFSSKKNKKTASEDQIIPVQISRAKRLNLQEKVELTADIRGYYEAQVFPKVNGKLKTRIKDVGSRVTADETVAIIDRDEPALEYAPAEVKAPFAGIITRYFTSEGEVVSPLRPLLEVAAIEKVKLLGQISEKDLRKIAVGQKANFWVDTYPNVRFSGEVGRLSQVLDALSRTATVEIISENPALRLKPGMFARVEIVVGYHSGVIVIPRQAVIYNPDGENIVFVVEENNRVRERKVQLGLELTDTVEIVSGIFEGERVVIVGQYNLRDGSVVEIVGGEK